LLIAGALIIFADRRRDDLGDWRYLRLILKLLLPTGASIVSDCFPLIAGALGLDYYFWTLKAEILSRSILRSGFFVNLIFCLCCGLKSTTLAGAKAGVKPETGCFEKEIFGIILLSIASEKFFKSNVLPAEVYLSANPISLTQILFL